jgi:NhaC family Na+:H+ antiporter
MNSAKKIPSPLVSLFPIAFLVGMLFATIHTFGSDALSGGSQISLLATTGMCVFIGMTFYRIPWKDYELAITNNISGVATAIDIIHGLIQKSKNFFIFSFTFFAPQI